MPRKRSKVKRAPSIPRRLRFDGAAYDLNDDMRRSLALACKVLGCTPSEAFAIYMIDCPLTFKPTQTEKI